MKSKENLLNYTLYLTINNYQELIESSSVSKHFSNSRSVELVVVNINVLTYFIIYIYKS